MPHQLPGSRAPGFRDRSWPRRRVPPPRARSRPLLSPPTCGRPKGGDSGTAHRRGHLEPPLPAPSTRPARGTPAPPRPPSAAPRRLAPFGPRGPSRGAGGQWPRGDSGGLPGASLLLGWGNLGQGGRDRKVHLARRLARLHFNCRILPHLMVVAVGAEERLQDHQLFPISPSGSSDKG